MASPSYQLSVILPFGDDEETIGSAVKRVANHLRELDISFELICVDEDSGDNSHALLGLLRGEVPELSIESSSGRGRGMSSGAAVARGAVLWMLSPQVAMQTLAAFGRAHRRVAAGDFDVIAMDGRYAVCRRARVLAMVSGMRGGPGFYERLAKRALGRDLRVERYRRGGAGASSHQERDLGRSPWSRLLDSSPLRAALTWIDGEA